MRVFVAHICKLVKEGKIILRIHVHLTALSYEYLISNKRQFTNLSFEFFYSHHRLSSLLIIKLLLSSFICSLLISFLCKNRKKNQLTDSHIALPGQLWPLCQVSRLWPVGVVPLGEIADNSYVNNFQIDIFKETIIHLAIAEHRPIYTCS